MLCNRYLNAFLKTAQAGSFARASEVLAISPTALIKQLNLFEHELKVKLLERSPRGVTLTEAGRFLYTHGLEYAREGERLEKALQDLQKEPATRLKVGTSPLTPGSLITEEFLRVAPVIPALTLEIVPFVNDPRVASAILCHLGEHIDVVTGLYDARFLEQYAIEVHPLKALPLSLAVPPGHPLYDRETVSFRELAGERLLLIRRNWMSSFDRARDLLEALHPSPDVESFDFWDVESFNRAITGKRALLVIAPWLNIHPLLKEVRVNWDLTASVGILHSRTPSPAVIRFLEALKEHPQV